MLLSHSTPEDGALDNHLHVQEPNLISMWSRITVQLELGLITLISDLCVQNYVFMPSSVVQIHPNMLPGATFIALSHWFLLVICVSCQTTSAL